MATFVRLQVESSSIKDELFRKLREAELNRKTEYDSAVRIQSWFRGIKVRAFLKFLHHCATVIQRQYRGHLDRIWYRDIVQDAVVQMRERYYNCMATRIQKVWRGYYTRKYIHNYYSRKRYLEGLKTKNSIVRKELEVWRISLEREKEIQRQKDEEAKKEAYNKRHHYLLSTVQIPGIYNARFNPEVGTKEEEIASARQRGQLRKHKTVSANTTSRSLNAESSVLPPIGKSAQGPFRKHDEVSYQRHRPLNPTLRVQTAYNSVQESRTKMKAEEWIARVVEKPFQPFTHHEKVYSPLLHTKSTFGSLPYGTKHFREECDKHVTQERFRTVVSPIPVFEQFGKTY